MEMKLAALSLATLLLAVAVPAMAQDGQSEAEHERQQRMRELQEEMNRRAEERRAKGGQGGETVPPPEQRRELPPDAIKIGGNNFIAETPAAIRDLLHDAWKFRSTRLQERRQQLRDAESVLKGAENGRVVRGGPEEQRDGYAFRFGSESAKERRVAFARRAVAVATAEHADAELGIDLRPASIGKADFLDIGQAGVMEVRVSIIISESDAVCVRWRETSNEVHLLDYHLVGFSFAAELEDQEAIKVAGFCESRGGAYNASYTLVPVTARPYLLSQN